MSTELEAAATYPLEPGQPNASTLEACFWEAILRCVKDDRVPWSLVPCDGTEDTSALTFPHRLPPQLWQYMAQAHAELREAAGV